MGKNNRERKEGHRKNKETTKTKHRKFNRRANKQGTNNKSERSKGPNKERKRRRS